MLNFLRSASIKTKMVLMSLFGLAGVCFILFGTYTYFRQIDNALTKVQTVDLRIVQIANALQVGMSDMNRLFEASVVERDQDTHAEAIAQSEKLRAMITEIGQISPDLKPRTGDMLKSFDDYVTEMRAYTDNVISGRFQGDEMYSAFSQALEKRATCEQKLRALGNDIGKDFSATMEVLRKDASGTFRDQFTYGLLLVLVMLLAFIALIRMITVAIKNVIGVAGEVAQGNLDMDMHHISSREFQHLFSALDVMRNRLKEQNQAAALRQQRQARVATLNEALRGELDLVALGNNILKSMAELLGVLGGAFYVLQQSELVMQASYARSDNAAQPARFRLGETLVGQCALNKQLQLISQVPPNYAPVMSGLGAAPPQVMLLVPLTFNDQLLGVLELLAFRPFAQDEIDFVQQSTEAMAIALHSAFSRSQLADALNRTRQQAEALEQQQEELRATNEELAEQTAILRASEESLQSQQEELRVMNEELEERNVLLDRQKEEIVRNNAALERSRQDLQEKALQLEQSGRYKSEFLSTMSHELRTPLNSILILSQGLMENRRQNLLDKQVEHARVIHSSGRDLLMLINDILDLSKVEEGKFELVIDELKLEDVATNLRAQFESQAEHKGLQFIVKIDDRLPVTVAMDEHRLNQILRNFISNALKFTHNGSIEVGLRVPDAPVKFGDQLLMPDEAIVFAVKDSGIGIPKDKQALIFEAFQQVDGTISRKYGGTGLGLTISRKLSQLMGGGITVASEGENKGTEFMLVLPRRFAGSAAMPPIAKSVNADEKSTDVQSSESVAVSQAGTPSVASSIPMMPESTDGATSNVAAAAVSTESTAETSASSHSTATRALLIIEDNPGFSAVLKNLATEFGFDAVCVYSAADAYRYLEFNVPASIILDLGLPDAPGEKLLGFIKGQPQTAHVPVHVISGNPDVVPSALAGAQEFIAKPFGRERLDQLFHDISVELNDVNGQRVLVIEDDGVQQEAIEESFRSRQIPCDLAKTGEEARKLLSERSYGAIVVDLDLPDCDGFALVEELRALVQAQSTPIIVYTARDLTKRQDADLRRYVTRIVLKTDRSINRLLNETSLFLHWLKGNEGDKLPPTAPAPTVEEKNTASGQRILLVDDDIRNLYSLSAVLEDSGWEVRTAGTGREALDILAEEGAFDLVLMDIMMPEMDGFEAMQRIRAQESFAKMPMIALTAKAMRDDRARCIEAGANDYVSKPVDNNKLKAIVKMWLGQS